MQWRAALRKRDRCQWFWRRARAAEWGSLLRSCLSCDGPEVRILSPPPHAPVAQRIEHLTTDQKVRGSNPFGRTSSDPYLVGAGLFVFITWQCSASRGIAGRGSAVLHLWPGFGHLSMVSRDLSMVLRHLCARCACHVCTCRCAVHLWPGYSESMGELCIDKTTNQLPCFSNAQQQVATRSTGNNVQQQAPTRTCRPTHHLPEPPRPYLQHPRAAFAWPNPISLALYLVNRGFRPAPSTSRTEGHFPILNSWNRLEPRLPSPYFDRSLDGRPSSRSP